MTPDTPHLPILLIRGEGYFGGHVEFHLLEADGATELIDRREGPQPGGDLETLVQDIESTGVSFSDVVVDLEPVKWLNSTGLGWLVGLSRRRKQQGDAVVLAGVNERIAQLLSTTSLDLVLKNYETVAAAAGALRGDGTQSEG